MPQGFLEVAELPFKLYDLRRYGRPLPLEGGERVHIATAAGESVVHPQYVGSGRIHFPWRLRHNSERASPQPKRETHFAEVGVLGVKTTLSYPVQISDKAKRFL